MMTMTISGNTGTTNGGSNSGGSGRVVASLPRLNGGPRSAGTDGGGLRRNALPSAGVVDADVSLVRRYLAGDSSAFEGLFRKYQTPIFNLVTRMVRGEDAYDVTQEVFLKALKALRSFRGDAKFSTWLFTIARHTCLNHLRHKQVLPETSLEQNEEEHPGVELADESLSIAAQCEVRELQNVVDEVLATLPHEARLLLILRDFEQMNYDEISQVTELSIVNVKSKIHRARLLFKKRFAPHLALLGETK